MSKARILYIETCGRTYGGPRSLIDILRNLDRNRFKPFLMLPREAEFLREIPKDVEVFEKKLASKSVKRKAGGIIRLLQDDNLRRKMGRKGRKLVEEKYNNKQMVKAHKSLYEELAKIKVVIR